MEGLPKIKLTEVEQKAYDAAAKRRRVFEIAKGEQAVAGLNEFLTKEGLTEKEWEKLQKKLGKEKKRMSG